jgi:hypothetical protein
MSKPRRFLAFALVAGRLDAQAIPSASLSAREVSRQCCACFHPVLLYITRTVQCVVPL